MKKLPASTAFLPARLLLGGSVLLEHMPHDSHFGGHLGCLSQALEVGVHVLLVMLQQSH